MKEIEKQKSSVLDSGEQDQHEVAIKIVERLCQEMDLGNLIQCIEKYSKDVVISILEKNSKLTENKESFEIYKMSNNFSQEKLKYFSNIIYLFSELLKGLTTTGLNKFTKSMSLLTADEKESLFEFMAVKYRLDNSMKQIENYFKDDNAALYNLNKMIKDKNPKIFLITRMIRPFIYGFGFIGYNDGLLTCAQVAARKNQPGRDSAYTFNPTEIYPGELKKYLEILKNHSSNLEVRERFMITGAHWLTCDVQIKNDKINILVIESFGKDKQHHTTHEILAIISEVFPNTPLFFTRVQRQGTEVGCAVFSLDDAIHLFTVENYLQEKVYLNI